MKPDPPLPSAPTAAVPGTLEKIAVMRRRVEQGFQPHHPGDARLDQNGIVRVPIIHPENFRIAGWRVATEAAYRRENRPEPWWEKRRDLLGEVCDYWGCADDKSDYESESDE